MTLFFLILKVLGSLSGIALNIGGVIRTWIMIRAQRRRTRKAQKKAYKRVAKTGAGSESS